MQALSSSSTYFFKFIFPVLTLLTITAVDAEQIGRDPYDAPLIVGAALIVGALEYWLHMRVKKVTLDGDTLLISNFSQEIKVPLSNLENASGSLGIRPEVVWLTFKQPTQFGKTVLFIPTTRMFPGFNHHPVAAMLKARAIASVGSVVE